MRTFAFLTASFSAVLLFTGCTESGLTSVLPMDTALEDVDTEPTDEEPTEEPADDEPDPVGEPIADAGPDRTMATGNVLSLDGTSSYDPAGLSPLSFEWTLTSRPSGSLAKLSDVAITNPSFAADVDGTYTFELTVQNSMGVWDTTPDVVTINSELDPILEPVANAGPDQLVDEGNLVYLNGAGSFDPSGLTPLQYQWNISVRPAGSAATLSTTTGSSPSFPADVPGTYQVQLAVANSAGVWDSTPDTVTINANEIIILPPVADAGPDSAASQGDLVTINGSASYDPGGLAPLQYQWTMVSKPAGSFAFALTPGSVLSSFVADQPGNYVFDLAVANTAGLWDPTPDSVTVTVAPPAVTDPIADAGVDQTVAPLDTVYLTGTSSYDPGGLPITNYQWTLVSKPSGSTTALSTTTSSTPNFFADLAGDYVFDLTVANSAGHWDPTPDRVTVTATPADGFYVEVSWDADSDLDLHILDGSTGLFGYGDANWCNMTPSWGASGSADDPSLDWDAILGWGPETTTITSPSAGNYQVKVHYYGTDGASDCAWGVCPASTATVKVFLGGTLAATYSRTMYQDDDLWEVATISWPSGLISATNNMTSTTLTSCF